MNFSLISNIFLNPERIETMKKSVKNNKLEKLDIDIENSRNRNILRLIFTRNILLLKLEYLSYLLIEPHLKKDIQSYSSKQTQV
jgi:hypothetical protein